MKKKQKLATFGILVSSLLCSSAALGGTVSFDASLASPNSTPTTPGWYDGSGNPNGGFTVANNNGIEIGLRAKYRQNPAVIDNPTGNLYTVAGGPQTNTTSGGAGNSPTHAAWNYEFSIDLQPNGVGTLTLADINAFLTVTDVTTGATNTINPLTYWNDDSSFGAGGKTAGTVGTNWGLQQSENPLFADFPLASTYNMDSGDLYSFTLTVDRATPGPNIGSAVLASDTILVQTTAVPLPASASMGLALLLGIGAWSGFRKWQGKRQHATA